MPEFFRFPQTPHLAWLGQGRALEGLVVRRESADWCQARAKLVRADFTQAMQGHWRQRALEWNRVDWSTR